MRGARVIFASKVACIAAALTGCGGDDDQHLWDGAMSPTQIQKAEMGRGPTTNLAPMDGDSEDPFIDNPNYPYAEEPWWDEPGYSGG